MKSIKQCFLTRIKNNKIALIFSTICIIFLGLVLIDGCTIGKDNTSTVASTNVKGVYAVSSLKCNNSFANHLSTHQPFHTIAKYFAHKYGTTTYGNASHYYRDNKKLSNGYILLNSGKEHHMTKKQWKNNQKSQKQTFNNAKYNKENSVSSFKYRNVTPKEFNQFYNHDK